MFLLYQTYCTFELRKISKGKLIEKDKRGYLNSVPFFIV